jgi:hypothetical protein
MSVENSTGKLKISVSTYSSEFYYILFYTCKTREKGLPSRTHKAYFPTA